MEINNTLTEFIKIEIKPNAIDKLLEQEDLIVSKVKPKNKNIAKEIIIDYSSKNPIKSIVDMYENDNKKLKEELENYVKHRIDTIIRLTKNL